MADDVTKSCHATLAVLAGGEGSRMGRPKALVKVGGRPILHFLLDRLDWPGPTALVTAPGREQPPGCERFDFEWVDPEPGLGPLRGMLTALERSEAELLVVAAVDMPSVRRKQLEGLLDALRQDPELMGLMTLRTVDGWEKIEPLPCAVRRSAMPLVREHLASGRRSLHGLARPGGFAALPPPAAWPAEVWTNLNSPDDWERWRASAGDRAAVD